MNCDQASTANAARAEVRQRAAPAHGGSDGQPGDGGLGDGRFVDDPVRVAFPNFVERRVLRSGSQQVSAADQRHGRVVVHSRHDGIHHGRGKCHPCHRNTPRIIARTWSLARSEPTTEAGEEFTAASGQLPTTATTRAHPQTCDTIATGQHPTLRPVAVTRMYPSARSRPKAADSPARIPAPPLPAGLRARPSRLPRHG